MDPVTGAITLASIASAAASAAVSTAVSMVVSWVFAPDVKGPRLKDLQATGQGYGAPIPTVYGTASVPGSIIWASDLIEREHESGGKGGSTTTYTYSQHVALAICEGEAQPLRIWAGGKLVVDFTTGTSKKKIVKYGNVTVYNGTETQTANATLQADMGVDLTPAYRGLCYVVLKNFQLEKFGNRLPPFQIEVSSINARAQGIVDFGSIGGIMQSPAAATYNSAKDKYITLDGITGAETLNFYETDIKTGTATLVSTYSAGSGVDGADETVVYVSSTDELWVVSQDRSTGWIFNADDYSYVTTFDLSQTWFANVYYHPGSDTVWAARDNLTTRVRIYNPASRAELTSIVPGDYVEKAIPVDDTTMLVLTQSALEVWSISGAVATLLDTHTHTSGGAATDLAFDTDNHIAAWVTGDSTVWYVAFPELVPAMFGDKPLIDWSNGVMTSVAHGGTSTAPYDVALDEIGFNPIAGVFVGVAHQIGLDFSMHVIDPETGLAMSSTTFSGPTNTCTLIPAYNDGSAMVAFDAGSQHAWLLPIGTTYYGKPVLLSEVVADICDNAGLQSTEYDVTDLADTWVDGYVVSRPISARDQIQPLRAAYWFDGAESESKVKFAMRGGAVVDTIPEDDLAASNGDTPDLQPFVAIRGPEEELPRQVDIHYIRRGGEYENAVQYDRVMNTESTGLESIELPIVLADMKARDAASVTLYTTRLERTQYAFATSRKYTHIEPMDPVSVVYDGVTYRVRITEKDEGGGIINWKAVPDDASLYTGIGTYVTDATTSSFYTATDNTVGGSVGSSDSGSETPSVTRTAPTYARFLDLPPLLASHSGVGIYCSVTPNRIDSTDEWEGAINYYSLDGGTNFAEGTYFAVESVVGQATSTLGDCADWTLVDHINTLTIEVAGTLSSTTWAGLMAGQNALLVGSEIVQFEIATLIGTADNGINRNYRISKLLRGRRGTESYVGTHAANEICVLLDSRIARMVPSETRLGDTIYRTATIGEDVDDLTSQTVSNTGNCLKPWAPVNLRAYKSAAANWDINLTWNRRDRLHGDAMLWAATLPMSESSESYDIEIYTTDFATLKRTITANASDSYAYTNAMQVTDFGSTQSAVGVKVYQNSAIVGRGFAASEALTAY